MISSVVPKRAALHSDLGSGWTAAIQRNADMQAPAGGVSSTARDLAQWMRLQLSEGKLGDMRIVEADALAETHEPLMARGHNPLTGATSFYGLGWNVEFGRHGLSWGHAGAFSVGGRSLVQLYPDAEIGIVVLANAFPTGAPEGLADSYFDLVFTGIEPGDWMEKWNAGYRSLFDPAIAAAKAMYADPPDPAGAALPLAAYAGRYANAYVGAALIENMGDGLLLRLGPGGEQQYRLKHFDRDLFLAFPDPEMPDKPSSVRFSIGPDARADTVTIEFVDGVGLGRLSRTKD
jgi:hypothetical protein